LTEEGLVVNIRRPKHLFTKRDVYRLLQNPLEEEQTVAHYHARSSSDKKAMVYTYTGGEGRTVDLENGTCSCRQLQDRLLPCRHAIALCREQQLEKSIVKGSGRGTQHQQQPPASPGGGGV